MSKIDTYPNSKSPPSDARVVTSTDQPGNKVALDVAVLTGSISGTFTPSGLKVALRVTTMTVGDVATLLPAVAFADRNAISIVNLDGANVLYIGDSSVTADRVAGITSGWEVNAGEGFNLDITDDVVLYGRAETGKTILIKIIEIA